MSNALLEAQAWGLACVVSDIPGNRAVVQGGVNGLVVSVGDAAALADALLSLLRDPALRVRLGRAARDTAAKQFDMNLVVGRVLELYGQLDAGRSA
jgi:glycosyltransferase involved in cell wall biosynthesis